MCDPHGERPAGVGCVLVPLCGFPGVAAPENTGAAAHVHSHILPCRRCGACPCRRAFGATSLEAKTLRYANQGDLKSLDPYTLNETTANAHLGHVYEGLTSRGKDLKIGPGLAERWEILDNGLRWRFYLRKGVKFQGGEDFTADDVIFSADRVRATGSNFQTRVPKSAKFTKVDDHTVDVVLESPNPILNAQWDTWYIVSKKWAEANGSAAPTPASATTPSHIALNANGTGAFRIESHQPGVRTVFKPNPNWWNKPEHNLTEIIFTPIPNDATRVAALLSGEVDVIEPVPVQDIQRVNQSGTVEVKAGPELRTIFLGFDQIRDELLESNVKGKNPFKDVRVRQAFNQAIDKETIKTRVMRGLSTPSPLMIAPELFSHAGFQNPKFDPEAAKKLLADAGYPNGFEVGMDCPNDRYVNDGPICQAVVGMLARIGVKVNLNAQPKAQYFAKVLKAAATRPPSTCLAGRRAPSTATTSCSISMAAALTVRRAVSPILAATATRRSMNLLTRSSSRAMSPSATR